METYEQMLHKIENAAQYNLLALNLSTRLDSSSRSQAIRMEMTFAVSIKHNPIEAVVGLCVEQGWQDILDLNVEMIQNMPVIY